MAGSSWPNLIAGRRARAADVEAKFDWLEGNLEPMLGGTKANNAYDLGTSTHLWRASYVYTSYFGDTSTFIRFDATALGLYAGGSVGLTISAAQNVIMVAGRRLYLDGGTASGIEESSNDIVKIWAGIYNELTIDGVNHGTVIRGTSKLFLDGSSGVGGDTYIVESSANNILIFTAGSQRVAIDANGYVTVGQGGAGGALGFLKLDGGSGSGGGGFISFERASVSKSYIGNAGAILNNTSSDLLIYCTTGIGASIYTNATEKFRLTTTWGALFGGDFIIDSGYKIALDGSAASDTYIVEGSANNINFWTAGVIRFTFDGLGNAIISNAAIATNATDGFVYISGCAGKPTGTPTSYAGRSPVVVDTSNNIPYFYANGAWRPMGQIIGMMPTAQTSTSGSLTSTAFTTSGQGKLVNIKFTPATSSATSYVYLDGVLIGSADGFIDSIGPVSLKLNNLGTATTLCTRIESATTTSQLFDLDLYYKSSMTVYFHGRSGGPITATVQIFYMAS